MFVSAAVKDSYELEVRLISYSVDRFVSISY